MLRPVLVTPAAETPVNLDEVKARLKVETSDDDAVLIALIAAAVSHLDGWTGVLGQCLVTQSWAQSFYTFPCHPTRLALGPVQSITSVKYWDTAGVEQTFDASSYNHFTDAVGTYIGLIWGSSWPAIYRRSDAVTVTYVCGYGAASAVPAAIKQAMLLLIAHWYSRRTPVADGQVAELPMSVSALLAPFRPQRI